MTGAAERPQSPARAPSTPARLGPLGAAQVVIEGWRWVLVLPVLAALLSFVVARSLPPVYTASATFVPESRSRSMLPAGVGALAGQFGFTLGAGEPAESPQFYAQLTRSRDLLSRLLDERFERPGTGDSVSLLALLDLEVDDSAALRERGVERLRQRIGTAVDRQTNVIRLSVDARDPVLAAAVANRVIKLIAAFNLQSRQSRARARRDFVGQRLAEATEELAAAEAALTTFYSRNRRWEDAPALVTVKEGLERQLTIHQEVFVTLRRELETARIEAVNDTPVITVIDHAVPPVEPARPRPVRMSAVAFLLGGLVGIAAAFGRRLQNSLRNDDDVEAAELRAAWRRMGRQMSEVLRRAKPAPPSGS